MLPREEQEEKAPSGAWRSPGLGAAKTQPPLTPRPEEQAERPLRSGRILLRLALVRGAPPSRLGSPWWRASPGEQAAVGAPASLSL